MTQIKRPTPYPEWVLMYRSGIPATRITPAVASSPSSTVGRVDEATSEQTVLGDLVVLLRVAIERGLFTLGIDSNSGARA